MIDEAFITNYITSTFENVETAVNLGYTFFFYRDDHMHAFATIASTGNEYEKISALDRPGVYRLNLGVNKDTFQSLFGKGKINVSAYDFTTLDVILPHPDYSSQHFLCVLSPVKRLSRNKSARCWRKRMTSPRIDITNARPRKQECEFASI